VASYALQLGDEEVPRYRAMAQIAPAAERELWEAAGISRGAVVADVGCGPVALSVLLAEVVGSEGRVWAVDSDLHAVKFRERTMTAAPIRRSSHRRRSHR